MPAQTKPTKSALIVIDGIGVTSATDSNAVTPETMPFLFQVMETHGYATLKADGLAVGLEEGQVGNSEVGHLTIGAGKVVPSMLRRINEAFLAGTWAEHPIWQSLATQPCRDCSRLHLIGLLSDAGVHGHWRTMAQAAQIAAEAGVEEILLHPVLDGNDSAAGSAPALLRDLQAAIATHPQIRLGLIMGRKWFCDRSGKLELTQTFVDALCGEVTHPTFTPEALAQHLAEAPSEVTFPPHLYPGGRLCEAGEPVLHASHRADRAVQAGQLIGKIRPFYSVIHLEGASIPERVFFATHPLDAGLAFTCKEHGINPDRIAEQCKFPHVTYFVNGFNPELGENSTCIPSIPDAQIPEKPEMSVEAIADRIVGAMEKGECCSLVANLANLDQVGHTGRVDLAKKAAQSINQSLERIASVAANQGWTLVLTSDHGNAEQMADDRGNPLGSHTFNPVPLTVLPAPGTRVNWQSRQGGLANVAATYLTTLAVPPAPYMEASLLQLEESVES